ncbi:hypothetical protein BD770DRAFT_319115 [Pilaira anomala]|nr:hypothetical protein BD770DRAFT_319115 [Pilaira anomala]
MFEPTIKYRRVNDPIKEPLTKTAVEDGKETKSITKEDEKETKSVTKEETKDIEKTTVEEYVFEDEEEESTIEVDPKDKERIIVTLSTGKQFSADRYCPHAGADLSYHGKVSEHDYPPEIGPVLMCPIHYWEFALEKEGKGGGGWATINACPIEVVEKCGLDKKLDW